jgi:PAS domain S-box-containing protein
MLGFAILCVGFTFLASGSLSLTANWLTVDDARVLIGMGRAVSLVGYPLFGIAVYRSALQDMWAYRQELQSMSEEALRQAQELRFLVDINRALSGSLDLDTILGHVVKSVTVALSADRCAIFLLNPDKPEIAKRVAYYVPLRGKEQLEQPTMPLCEQPTLEYVLRRRKPLILNVKADNPRLQSLYKSFDCQGAGPTIIQPLLRQRRVLGVMVVGNDHCKRDFLPREGQLCESIAVQIAASLENVFLYHDMKAQAGQLAKLLQSQEEEVRRRTAVLESIAEGVIVSDRERRVVDVNTAAERIMGSPRQRIIGRPLEQVVGTLRSGSEDWKSVVQSNTPVQTVFELDRRIVHVSAAPILTPASDHLGIVAVLRDVTEERAAEQARSEFITAISHELRTPLTAIQGYAETLTGGMVGAVDDTQSHFISVIRDNALRMVNLSDNLIAIAQIEKGFLQLEYGKADVNLIISDVVQSFQSQLETRQLKVVLELADDLPVIEADPARVRQVVDNLFSNATKFTYPGGSVTVGARLFREEDEQATPSCSIWVSDTGIGISPEEKSHIWERFYRPVNPLTVETSGLGVGLSIVKSLVEAHGGRVWMESTLGVGSTFTVLLPITRRRPISD